MSYLQKFVSVSVVSAVFCASASAVIVGAVWGASIQPPTDVRLNMTEHNGGFRGMNEFDPAPPTALLPDFGLDLSNIYFECHLLHFDPVTDPLTRTGGFQFDNPIIGIITDSDTLDDFDIPCAVPGMVYPAPGAEPLRGLEASQADSVEVLQNPAGVWNRVRVTGEVDTYQDQVRVITCRDPLFNATCNELADSVGWDNLTMPSFQANLPGGGLPGGALP